MLWVFGFGARGMSSPVPTVEYIPPLTVATDGGPSGMVYLLATFANDADYMPSLLHALTSELEVGEQQGTQETWGVGYYADDRALLIKKPASILDERNVYELAPEVRSRIVIACATPAADREAAAPFRFRNWLFAGTGALASLEPLHDTVAAKLPEFIRTEIRQDMPGGLAFGMFLAELHRSGLLEDALAPGVALGRALARSTETIQRLTTEASGSPAQASFVASNGRIVLISQAGAPLCQKLQVGLERLPDGPPDPALTDFNELAAALKRFKAVVVAPGDFGARPGWTNIEPGKTLVIDGQLQVTEV